MSDLDLICLLACFFNMKRRVTFSFICCYEVPLTSSAQEGVLSPHPDAL
jgi:hypothetical protein